MDSDEEQVCAGAASSVPDESETVPLQMSTQVYMSHLMTLDGSPTNDSTVPMRPSPVAAGGLEQPLPEASAQGLPSPEPTPSPKPAVEKYGLEALSPAKARGLKSTF